MNRVLAVLAAVVMITGAVLIRSRLDDNPPKIAAKTDPSGPLTIVCVTELQAECDALHAAQPDVNTRVEDAATTADALAKGKSDADGWLTMEPWPEIANGLVTKAIFTSSTPIASSPLVIAMAKEREVVLAPNCAGGVIGWKCLGDNVGRPWTDLTGGVTAWGNITVGNPRLTSATGMLLYGNAITGYFGRTDIATNDLANDSGFGAWNTTMKSTFSESDPFLDFVAQLPTKFGAVGATSAEEQTNIGVHTAEVTVVNPVPLATAVVELAPVADGARAQRVEQLASAASMMQTLQQQGWTIGQIPAQTGLPSPDVMLALSDLVR